MMAKTGPLVLGDKCPRCGGEFKAAKLPTQQEYDKAFHSNDAPGLPEGSDTMNPEDRAEHGNLYICDSCGLNMRFKAEAR